MNPSQEEPTKEEFLDGELSEEQLYTIAAGSTLLGLNTSLLGINLGVEVMPEGGS